MKSLALTCLITFACGVGTALLVSATPTRTSPRPVVLTRPVHVPLKEANPNTSRETGLAFHDADKRTASGEPFDKSQFIVNSRVIDLSLAATHELQMDRSGLDPVELEMVR